MKNQQNQPADKIQSTPAAGKDSLHGQERDSANQGSRLNQTGQSQDKNFQADKADTRTSVKPTVR